MSGPTQRHISIILISDSTGETARTALNAAVSQYPNIQATYIQIPFVRQAQDLDELCASDVPALTGTSVR